MSAGFRRLYIPLLVISYPQLPYFKNVWRYSFEGLALTVVIFLCFSWPVVWYRCYLMSGFHLGWGECPKN